MPQFTEETFAYEILLRFGEGDTTKGKLTGAHYQTVTQVKRDGVIISSKIDTPQQLALLEGESGQMLSEVLGGVTAETIIHNQTLAASVATLQAQADQMQTSISERDVTIDDLRAQLEALSSDRLAEKELTPS